MSNVKNSNAAFENSNENIYFPFELNTILEI